MTRRQTKIAKFSPSFGVTKPSTTRPIVKPSQKPVDVMPAANGAAFRTRSMNVTIQPPRATSMPTYVMRKTVQIQVIRADGLVKSASFKRLPLTSVGRECAALKRAPVEDQKDFDNVASSSTLRPIFPVVSTVSKCQLNIQIYHEIVVVPPRQSGLSDHCGRN